MNAFCALIWKACVENGPGLKRKLFIETKEYSTIDNEYKVIVLKKRGKNKRI